MNRFFNAASSADSEREWMLRFKEGDKTAFGELLRRYEKPVINLAFKFLGGREEAEDAAQETFLEIYRRAGSYKPTGKLSSWIFTIAAHICLNLKRKKKRALEIPLEETAESPIHTPPGILERAELQPAVGKALLALPDTQRLAVILARFEGMTLEEISRVLGVSAGAVKQLLHRAKNSLKNHLRPFMDPSSRNIPETKKMV